jgi:F0F1-type ATP synthase assembly protein I
MKKNDANEEQGPAGGGGQAQGEGGDDEDLRARFPDVGTDERLRVPRGDSLPHVPDARFERPVLRRPEDDALAKSPRLKALTGDLRGFGMAGTVGMTLVFSIGIGAGLGWAVDHFLLKDPPTPWGLIVGFLLGTASGFINLVRVTNRLNPDDEKRK